MNYEERLSELKKERDERNPKGWEDYSWCSGEGDFNQGQISLLEEILNVDGEEE